MQTDDVLLIGVIEAVVTMVLTVILSKILRGRPSSRVVTLAGSTIPFIIFAVPLALMLRPGAGPGEGMLFALAMVVAGVSLPVCLAVSAVTSLVLHRNRRA
jgi:hypothetical protein